MFTAYNMRIPPQRNPQKSGIKMRDMGIFLGQLLLRSFDRAERVYISMKCRGFDGVYITGKHKNPRICDSLYAIILTAAIIFLRFFNVSLFVGRIF